MSESSDNQIESLGTNRRQLLTRAGVFGAAALGSGMLKFGKGSVAEAALSARYGIKKQSFAINDVDILNFALNLEYLEAEYYQRAAFGKPLTSADTGGATNNVTGGTLVPFASTAVAQYAEEIATDELNHVRFLRTALGAKAVVEPTINFTDTFTALAVAAGVIPMGSTFDPFANDLNFLIGSFVFEDVGVTAYHGAAPYIKNSGYLAAAAGILAVEAYHAGEIRTLIFQAGATAIGIANKISGFRNTAAADADPTNNPTEAPLTNTDGSANIIPTDANSLAFARTFPQVLNIVYGSTAFLNSTTAPTPGGFFPNGLNGRIK